MSGLQRRLDNVRDSIASLFKKRQGAARRRAEKSSSCGDSGGGCGGGGGISTPQNVKRVMHITFDAGSQSFDGIPAAWRQHFEAQRSSASAEPPPPPPTPPPPPPPREAEVETKAPAAAEAAATNESEAGTPETEDRQLPESAGPQAPRVLLSLVFDRDAGQFVNLPPHWADRLQRNSLLRPEFQTNPELLPLVFSLMDEELRAMRSEGARVDSCLYTSPYVFQIEADRSNSSSELDLLAEDISTSTSSVSAGLALPNDGSFVTVSAVELPELQGDADDGSCGTEQ